MQSFVCGTRLCFGADAPAALAGLHAERVLLVTDPYFAENGTAARYAAAFPGAQVEQFSDVAPDPPLSLVARGVARLQALRPDTVLALGGGSAIDCAKGIAALGGLPVRLVAVPTTSIWRPPWRRWPLTMRASAPATRWLMPSAGASM